MNRLEDPAFLGDRLMMGPDGAVYVVHTWLRAALPDDFGHASAPSLAHRHSKGGEVPLCFKFSTEAPRRDDGNIPACFRFSAEAPRRDSGDIPACFKYSAVAPRRDPDVPICFRFSADAPRRDDGNIPICFAY
jgi:hypothetical protein